MAGTLDRLSGDLPQWDPAGVVLEQLDATHWTISLEGQEGTQIEYKYVLGAWDWVEKGEACEELSNRRLTLAHGSTGKQVIDDVVANWRNVGACPD